MSAVRLLERSHEAILAPNRIDMHPCVAYPDLYPDEGEPLSAGRIHNQAGVFVFGFIASCLRAQGLKHFDVAFDVFLYETPEKWTMPDILAYRDVRPHPQGIPRTFHLDFEGPPDLVMEILSTKTWQKDVGLEDIGDKKQYYQDIGVLEYWIYDPEGLRKDKRCTFEGFHLVNGQYAAILPSGTRWHSHVLRSEWELGEIQYREGYSYPLVRLVNPITGQWYPTLEEQGRIVATQAEVLATQSREIAILRRRLGLTDADKPSDDVEDI